MARSSPIISTVFCLFLLLSSPTFSNAVSYTQLRTLFSLAHSLVTRVSNLRAARGDLDGSRRARFIAEKLERGLGLGFWRLLLSMGWDYVRNYSWRDSTTSFQVLAGVVYDAKELLSSLNELTRLRSDAERAAWVGRNYKNVLRISNSLFGRLLTVFRKSGPLREMVETLKIEFEGDLLRDCIEVGANDLKGLIQILKDLALQYTSAESQEL
ncbi:hypothetical protein V2J09_019583 [Rumex salicifolius]